MAAHSVPAVPPMPVRPRQAGRALHLTRWLLWPVVVAASFAGFALAMHLEWDPNRQMILPGIVIAVLFLLEPRIPHHGDGGHPRAALVNDIGHNLLGFAGNPLGQLIFLSAAAGLAGAISERWGGNLWPTAWPMWLQVLLVIVLGDGLEYARHRIAHTHPFFWRFHALHHSMETLDAMKSGRNHFMDLVFRALFVYAPLVALGAPTEVLIWIPAVVTVLGPIAHANLDLRLPAFVHWLVLTPQLHRIHHASALDRAQSNYANVFPFWDMLFGTYRGWRDDTSTHFGIENDPMPRGFVRQVLAPFTPKWGEE